MRPARLAAKDALSGAALSLLLVLITFGASGCASTPRVAQNEYEPDGQPSTFLAGARVDDARSVAMASARSKGWTLVSTDGDALILQRAIAPDSPQVKALGTLPGAPAPLIEVNATFVQHNQGTEVGLRAFVIVNPGTEDTNRIDYTHDYQNNLAISLSSLQSAWLATGHRLTTPAPLPATPAAPAPDDITNPEALAATEALATSSASQDAYLGDLDQRAAAPGSGFFDTAWGDATKPIDDTPWREQDAQWSDGDHGASRVDISTNTSASDAPWSAEPILDRSTQTPDLAPTSNQMLVLDSSTRTGIWAYYAEQFAQQQGCAVDDAGAVLLRKTSAFELHEVGCRQQANLLIKCEAGVCQSMSRP